MNTSRQTARRWGIGALLTLLVGIAGTFHAPQHAHAATVLNCAGKPSKHIGFMGDFHSSVGTYFGKAEWRYGTSGSSCKGYKWVNIYVTRAFNIKEGMWLGVNRVGHVHDQASKYWDVSRITEGTWHSYAMYGYHRSLEAVSIASTKSGNNSVDLDGPYGTGFYD